MGEEASRDDIVLTTNGVGESYAFRFAGGTGVEMMKFCHDGRVYVRGELVDSNIAVYEAFKAWLRLSMGGGR